MLLRSTVGLYKSQSPNKIVSINKDYRVPLFKKFLFIVTSCFTLVAPSSTKNKTNYGTNWVKSYVLCQLLLLFFFN